jgi:integrase
MPKLTISVLDKLQGRDKPYKIYDSELKGFFARVQPTGRRTFGYFYRNTLGKARDYTIGAYPGVTAMQARKLAQEAAGNVAAGIDVHDVRKATRQAAQAQAAEAEKEALSTLGAFLDSYYLNHCQQNHRSDKAVKSLTSAFGYLHGTPMHQIDIGVASAYRNRKLAEGVSQATVNRNLGDLRTCLNVAVTHKFLDANGLAGIKMAKLDNSAVVRYLSPAEEERLRAVLAALSGRDRFMQPLTLLALNTGMRRGELFNLTWADIDLVKRLLTVQGGGSKSGQTRFLPLNKEATTVMQDWSSQGHTSEGAGLVFPHPVTGKRLANIQYLWSRIMDAASIEGFRFHDVRHSFASSLVQRSVDLNTVRELLGHADISLTLRYAHLSPEVKANAMAVLD